MTKLIAFCMLAGVTAGCYILATKPAYPQTYYLPDGGVIQTVPAPMIQPRTGAFSNGLNSGLGALNTHQNTEYLNRRTHELEMDNAIKEMRLRQMCAQPEYRDMRACNDWR